MGDKGVEGDPYDLPDPDLKIILLGDSAVGKSKLIERYLMDEYNPRQVLC
jgi:Rab-like protein 2